MSLAAPYYFFIIAAIAAMAVALYAVKKIIFITRKRKLYDIPDNIRKIHGEQIPSLGGVGIFIGFIATAPFFIGADFKGWNYMIISMVILFFTGVYDDIMNMRPYKKLVAQLIASAVTVYFADIRFSDLHGLFGQDTLSYWPSLAVTTIGCTFFINVFNFIDGIDGLACLLSILYTAVFGSLFAIGGHSEIAAVAFCMLGATAGLLYYNYPPAKIYMGDTGSMLLGFVVFILAVIYLQSPHVGSVLLSVDQGNVFVMAVLFLPVFDAFRVFTLRLANGISPLKADRRHLHYFLLDAGLTHAATAWLLVAVNIVTISIALLLQKASPVVELAGICLPAILVTIIAARRRRSRGKRATS